MESLDILKKGFVAFMDGLWWGLRDSVGALSMYEGYSNGFKQFGSEIAESIGGKGAEDAAKIAVTIMSALGLEVEQQGKEVIVKSCPLWNRILERGLEYAFHLEKICWLPLMEGIAEKVGGKPSIKSSLRTAYVERAKVDYKKSKAKRSLDAGKISEDDYKKQVEMLEKSLEQIVDEGRYRFD